jgi:hypothetical protein
LVITQNRIKIQGQQNIKLRKYTLKYIN